MTDAQMGLVITGLFMLAATALTGWWAHKNKKTPEPTPIEKLWTRLDQQDEKIERLDRRVTAYRGGFLAFVSWSERVSAAWTGPIPIVAFTPSEEQAIKKGRNAADLDAAEHDGTD